MQYYLLFIHKNIIDLMALKAEDEKFYKFFLKLTYRLEFYKIVK